LFLGDLLFQGIHFDTQKRSKTMSVPAAFLGVVIIWSTTPVAIQWSSEGWGFLFGVTGRMAIGALFCLIMLKVFGDELRWHKSARRTYFIAAAGIYGAMLSVYWGAQYIPSGLISVLFGLSPIVTAFMASAWLQEHSLSVAKIAGALLGLVGVSVIFLSDSLHTDLQWQGIAAVLTAVVLQCASGVWIKRISTDVSGLALTTGALLLVVPMFVLTWIVFSDHSIHHVTLRASASLVYLGIIGSVLGFTLYFYVLKHVQASKVALITLMTPVSALFIGQGFNGEHISTHVWYGTVVILAALLVHQWGDRLWAFGVRRAE
jgi:drug/metabolite transporter (DMT)-like permease